MSPLPSDEDSRTEPVSMYGLTKLWQERLLWALAAMHGIDLRILRLQNVYGPLQTGSNPAAGIVATLARGALLDGRVELYEDGEVTRDFVHVDDVARAMVSAITGVAAPPMLNVGTGRRTSLRQVVQMLSSIRGASPAIVCAGRYRAGDVRHAAADMTRYQRAHGAWAPIELADGLASYVGWLLPHLEGTPCRV